MDGFLAAKAAGKLILERPERCVQDFAPSHDHIVSAGRHVTCRVHTNGLMQTPADAIALHGVADFLSHGDTQARGAIVAALQNFKQKKRTAPLDSAADRQKLGALLKPRGMPFLRPARQRFRPRTPD